MTAEILRGAKARLALENQHFLEQWQRLHDACPWATVFQGSNFSRIWYRHYGDIHEPILIVARNDAAQLTGLLCLAFNQASGELCHCGGAQAEYQCWLSGEDTGKDFLDAALASIRSLSNNSQFRFKFLPPQLTAKVEHLSASLQTSARFEERPLVEFDADPPPWQSLTKKSNKSKLSRLRKLGDVDIRLLETTDPDALARAMDRIAADYDFRQGAINDSRPFKDDPRKMPFHLDLLQNSDEFQMLGLCVGDAPVATIVGCVDRGAFGVCIFSHSAELARHSPGKFLVAMGAKLLAEQGLDGIDLTPGGTWKSRFANNRDSVCELTIHFSAPRYWLDRLITQASTQAKRALASASLEPKDIRDLAARVRARLHAPSSAPGAPGDLPREYQIYTIDSCERQTGTQSTGLSRNNLDHLLRYTPAQGQPGIAEFLSTCLARLERGEQVYSQLDGEQLAHAVWVTQKPSTSLSDSGRKGEHLPEAGTTLYALYAATDTGKTASYRETIGHVLAELAMKEPPPKVLIGVYDSDEDLRAAVTSLGFTPLEQG